VLELEQLKDAAHAQTAGRGVVLRNENHPLVINGKLGNTLPDH
jgi:hypothetical protein